MDNLLLQQFEAGILPLEQWRHREHVKVAYLYLCQGSVATATQRMRTSLIAYNASQGVTEDLNRGYHETLTEVWMRLVEVTLAEFGPSANADAFVDKQSQLLCKRAPLFFYSYQRIMSTEAKQHFLAPDLAPLPTPRCALRSGG